MKSQDFCSLLAPKAQTLDTLLPCKNCPDDGGLCLSKASPTHPGFQYQRKVQVGGFPYNMSPILVVMAPPASWAPIDPALAGVTCYSGRIHQALDGATHLYGVGNLERKEWWKHHRDWGFLPKAGGKAGCGISTCQMCMFVHIHKFEKWNW